MEEEALLSGVVTGEKSYEWSLNRDLQAEEWVF